MAATKKSASSKRQDTQNPIRNALVAAAKRLTTKSIKNEKRGKDKRGWQDDAWDMYRLVGEERFLATTLAGRLAQAKLFVGKVPEDETDDPEEQSSGKAYDVWRAFAGGSRKAKAQIIYNLGINLFVPGEGYVVGIPKQHLMTEEEKLEAAEKRDPSQGIGPEGVEVPEDVLEVDIADLEWRMLSLTEVHFDKTGEEITLDLDTDKSIKVNADSIFLIRVWRPDPEKHWEADSPVRSSLPVLRELVGLTMHTSAQLDQRLAGAGVFVVPESARQAFSTAQANEDDAEAEDPFMDALMEAMLTPVSDRASAAALVPLLVGVPDDSTGKFQHITFSSELDKEARPLREEAIRRLALGQDAPPELLLGVGGMNHWGAWLVREDVVTTHIEPPLELICDALTEQYLWPVLEADGMSADEAREYVITYDVAHMIVRPNRLEDAVVLHEAGVISGKALREAGQFEESDAPPVVEGIEIDPVVQAAMDMVSKAPTLLSSPGLPAIVAQLREVIEGGPPADKPDGETAEGQSGEATDGLPADGPPADDGGIRSRRDAETSPDGMSLDGSEFSLDDLPLDDDEKVLT